MTRAELTAQSRFQQSMRVLTQDRSGRSPYGLHTATGTLGARDPQTGDRAFTDSTGVVSPTRDLQTGAYPTDHDASTIVVLNGQNYAR